jgi:hypothetical protein
MEDTFKIRSYGFGELAHLYLPNILRNSATRRLRSWIRHNPKLSEELIRLGYSENTRLLTPAMVSEIISLLGEP